MEKPLMLNYEVIFIKQVANNAESLTSIFPLSLKVIIGSLIIWGMSIEELNLFLAGVNIFIWNNLK